jgi:hypothetical protein
MRGGDKRIGYLAEKETVHRTFVQESLLSLANEKSKTKGELT